MIDFFEWHGFRPNDRFVDSILEEIRKNRKRTEANIAILRDIEVTQTKPNNAMLLSLFGGSLKEEKPVRREKKLVKKEFDNDFLGASNEVVTTTDKADAISAQAKKFLRDFKSITRSANTKKAADALMDLIDKGTFTPLPNEIRKLKRLIDKKTVTYGQADNLIIGIAEKYDAFDNDEDSDDFKVDIDLNISPEIVITETFKN